MGRPAVRRVVKTVHIVGSIPAAVAGGSDREDENWMDIIWIPKDINWISKDIFRISYLDIDRISIGYI